MRHLPLFLALLIGQAALAAAPCDPSGGTPAVDFCAQQDYEAADRALNAQYKKTRARLPAAAKGKLLAEQRAWIKARDPACTARLKNEEGGTIWTSMFSECQAEATRERTAQLRNWEKK